MFKTFLIFFMVILALILSCSDNPASPNDVTTGEITDIDGNIYKTVKIGNKWWMSENLRVTHFRNGDNINSVTDKDEWSALRSAAYCNYGNDTANVLIYGRLYNWYAVDDDRILAPKGWHVASDEDWQELEKYFGMKASQADSTGYRGTDEAIKIQDNPFNTIAAGFREPGGDFTQIGSFAYWWTSTEFCTLNAWLRGMSVSYGKISRNFDSKIQGFSIRCVRD